MELDLELKRREKERKREREYFFYRWHSWEIVHALAISNSIKKKETTSITFFLSQFQSQQSQQQNIRHGAGNKN